ncbi:MAG TPA: hypothetical protein PK903_04645 [Paludibacteraceae bacterium]|jgi:hypothetical protein|nr:hypothetical protein [Paludibacteraceae bacterium]MDS1031049.1 hypothetical protein [Porphyromonadaceae sp. NP-X]HNZ62506.1 hypothetical protein [Paludibacteraceae bacterium]HOH55381.1 hypothetical protein [Paludibacteraceae bacterium]
MKTIKEMKTSNKLLAGFFIYIVIIMIITNISIKSQIKHVLESTEEQKIETNVDSNSVSKL